MIRKRRIPFWYKICIGLMLCSSAFSAGRIGIIVNKDLYSFISQSLDTYIADLKKIEGKDVWLEKDTYSPKNTSKEMKDNIKKEYDGIGLEGVILIGDLPIQKFLYNKESPDIKPHVCDLYYMDLDGEWVGQSSAFTDHTGKVAPEIWVSRITPSVLEQYLGDEADAIKVYFEKVHKRMTGQDSMERKMVIAGQKNFWPEIEKGNLGDLGYEENQTTLIEGEKCGKEWKEAIIKGQEYGVVYSHSFENNHQIGFTIQELAESDVKVRFYNCFACYNGNYVKANMGGLYALGKAGLVSLSSTKSGSIFPTFFPFYNKPLGSGKCFGEAFKEFMAEKGHEEIIWHYGLTLQGVGTLKIKPYNESTALSNNSPTKNPKQLSLIISPNPVNRDSEKIVCYLSNTTIGSLYMNIYDALGNCVYKETIVTTPSVSGTQSSSFSWDLKTVLGKKVSPGTYLMVLNPLHNGGTCKPITTIIGIKEQK